jgi:hypothetical protein
MLIETVSASLLASILKKGKLSNLKNIYIRGWYFLLAAGILQVLLLKISFLKIYFYPVMILSYLSILLCLGLNYKSIPMRIVFIGTFLNFTAIALNDGLMPVSLKGLEFAGYDVLSLTSSRIDTFHCLITESTRLRLLSDIIPIPEPYPFPQMLSIGDFFIMAGVFLFIMEAVKPKNAKA